MKKLSVFRICVLNLCMGLCFLFPTSLEAIDELILFDFSGEFESGEEELSSTGTAFDIIAGGQILGGELDIEVLGNSSVSTTGNTLSVSAPDTVFFTFDGGDEDQAISFDELGQVDLTEDINTNPLDAFLLTFSSVANAGSFSIEVYTDEETFSVFSMNLPVSAGPTPVVIPYSSFQGNEEGDPAEFNRINAIVIVFEDGFVAEVDQLEVTSSLGGMTMVDQLLNDVNLNGMVDPGDRIRYSITIPAASSGTGAELTMTPDADTLLVVGSVSSSHGSVTSGNTAGDTDVTVLIGTLPASDVTITLDVLIADPLHGGSPVCNQATLSVSGGSSIVSDDPDDATGSTDFTCTEIFLDTTPPVLTVPADVEVADGDDTTPSSTGQATASDDVSANPVISFVDSVQSGPLPYTQRITRTWTATDDANNSSQGNQLITITGLGPSFELAQELPSLPVLGLFSPASTSGKRQLGQISIDGAVSLLGTENSLSSENITMASGITAFNRQTQTFYCIGETSGDGLSRIFTVSAEDGSSSSAVLSSGTASSIVGIWYDEVQEVLYGVFQVGPGLAQRQLASINPSTGLVSFIGIPNSSITGSIGGSVTGNSEKAVLHFLGKTGALPGHVINVELATGAMSAKPLLGANYNAISGMEYSIREKKLYALIFVGSERRLATLNPQTGMVNLIGPGNVGGGGVSILTYSGVNTVEEFKGTFLFIGRYNNGMENKWAIWGVDLKTGESSFHDIDTSQITPNGYYGLEYANLRLNALHIIDFGFTGANVYIDVENGTDGLKATSTADLLSDFFDIPGLMKTNDGNGQPNRFIVPAASLHAPSDFFRIEPE